MIYEIQEVIKIILDDGWFFVRQSGSHQQYHHKQKIGIVTIAGKLNDDIHPKSLRSILKQVQIKH